MNAVRLDRAPSSANDGASVREDERRRLARDLHDGPAQTLAAALFGVDLAIAVLDRSPGAARDELRLARQSVRDALDDVRALMAGLRPRQLEDHGLVVALQTLAAIPPLRGTGVSVETQGIADGERLSPEIELGLYRIAQEAVSNARRHGAASHVKVSLAVSPARVELTILDNGRGWTGDRAAFALGRGEGIPGMRERAQLLRGELTVESAPGCGTRVSAVAPLPGSGLDLGEDTP